MTGWEIPIGAAIAFGAGAIGTGWAQSRIGAAGAGTVVRGPKWRAPSSSWKRSPRRWRSWASWSPP